MTSLSFSINHTSSHAAGQRLQSKAKVHLAEYTIHTWPWQCPLTSSLLAKSTALPPPQTWAIFWKVVSYKGLKEKANVLFQSHLKVDFVYQAAQGTTSA